MTPKQPADADPLLLAEALNLALQTRYDEAIEACTRYISLHPDDISGYMRRALVLKYAERLDEMVADWDQILVIRPGSPMALYRRGEILEEMNRYEEAIRDFNAAEAAAPRMNWDVIALRRARCLAALNRFDEATRDLDRIPDNDGPFTRNRDELWEWISRRR